MKQIQQKNLAENQPNNFVKNSISNTRRSHSTSKNTTTEVPPK